MKRSWKSTTGRDLSESGLAKQIKMPGDFRVKVPRPELGRELDNVHLLPDAMVWCRRCVLYTHHWSEKLFCPSQAV